MPEKPVVYSVSKVGLIGLTRVRCNVLYSDGLDTGLPKEWARK